MHPPALDRLLADLATGPGRVVLTGHLDGVEVPPGVEVVDLEDAPPPTPSAAVVLVVDDRRDLRALAFPRLGRTRTVALVLRAADDALDFPWLPTWPEPTGHDVRVEDGGSVSIATYARRVAAHEVFAGLAGAAGAPSIQGCRGLVIGFVRGGGQPVPPADPTYVEISPDTRMADLVVPPDVVLSATPLDLDESPVTGRVPVVLDARGDAFVDEGLVDAAASTSSYAWREALAERAGIELPPLPPPRVDATSRRPYGVPLAASPIGFDPAATGPLVDLSALDPDGPITALVATLRVSRGVRIDQDPPIRLTRDLAMAGVPMTAANLPLDVRSQLGEAVASAIEQPVDLADALAREEHSIVVRRAALDAFGGTDSSATPVTILLATKRPEMLDHVLAQVARQRGVDLELVLAPHGFEPDPARVRSLLDGRSVQIVPRSSDTLFGRVLADAAASASGEVLLKMDDDDWYGPDFVADLVRARTYSGAPVVGCATEYVYLSDRDLTIRQGIPAEKFTNFVAGGTLMIDLDLYRVVGGFRSVRKYVDAQLLAGVRAVGAPIYRTHGLGYVLRRNPVGHTWTLDADSLIVDTAVTTPGFTPSRLLEYDGP